MIVKHRARTRSVRSYGTLTPINLPNGIVGRPYRQQSDHPEHGLVVLRDSLLREIIMNSPTNASVDGVPVKVGEYVMLFRSAAMKRAESIEVTDTIENLVLARLGDGRCYLGSSSREFAVMVMCAFG